METNNTSTKTGLSFGLIGLVLGVIITFGVISASGNLNPEQNNKLPAPAVVEKVVTKIVPAPAMPHIADAVVVTSIDATGKGVNPTNTFDANSDAEIYVVGTLENITKGTKVEYVRYLDGKYLDSKIGTIDKDGVQYYSFVWKTKTAESQHPQGVYTVKLYLNGDVNEAVTYRVN